MTVTAVTLPRRRHAIRTGAGCAIVTACALTGTLVSDPLLPTPQAIVVSPRVETRAVEFAALVQDMTTRQQQVLDQLTRAAATNTGAVPLAAAPVPAAAIPGVDVVGTIASRVGSAFTYTAQALASMAFILGFNLFTQGISLTSLAYVAGYLIASPVLAVATFLSVLTGLPVPGSLLSGFAAVPAPTAAEPVVSTAVTTTPPATLAATPAPTAAVPGTNPIGFVQSRLTRASQAFAGVFLSVPFVLMSGLQLPRALAPIGSTISWAFAALSPVIAAANFVSVLVTGKSLPYRVNPLPVTPLNAATPNPSAAIKPSAAQDNSAPDPTDTTKKAGKKPAKAAPKPRPHRPSATAATPTKDADSTQTKGTSGDDTPRHAKPTKKDRHASAPK